MTQVNGHSRDTALTLAPFPQLRQEGPALEWPQPPVPPATETAGEPPRSLRDYPWPLLIIAAPAAVAIWSGWVGLGEMCGFGPIHPLPGIADTFTINTAITLPVGVEAYGAYALAVWLGAKKISAKTRNWARASAVGALALGCLGQIAFHLLAAAKWTQAPWWITMVVSCLPVVSLALAAALAHMVIADIRGDTEAAPVATEDAPEPDADSDTEDVIDDADERHDSDESSDTDSDKPEPPKPPRQRQETSPAGDKVTSALRRSKRLRDLLASDSAADRKAAKNELAEKAGVSVRTVERILSESAKEPS